VIFYLKEVTEGRSSFETWIPEPPILFITWIMGGYFVEKKNFLLLEIIFLRSSVFLEVQFFWRNFGFFGVTSVFFIRFFFSTICPDPSAGCKLTRAAPGTSASRILIITPCMKCHWIIKRKDQIRVKPQLNFPINPLNPPSPSHPQQSL